MAEVILEDLGLIDYKKAWDYQEQLFKSTIDLKIEQGRNESEEKTKNFLLFCEHPHVYTLGKSGDQSHLLLSEERLEEIEATYYKINRGGDITYHGPGQLVMYPIFDLETYFFTDIHKYMRFLEEAVILTIAEYGVKGGRVDGYTGVWIDGGTNQERKICAMGVKSSRWVTMHGIGFNVNTDLNYFNYIVPCGIEDKSVTSLQKELGHSVDMNEIKAKLQHHVATLFNAKYTEKK
ncbi:lipoyl(octanoyl) transferase LipB [Brumimicrobium aurantiacum]|uniref:Octanoyltransferase n=1 Tax=Brumimicrobium aurantiacum TaxID=1737063 RepID=A0A3E1F1V4_9FLAO|nr:lipoyl(octanoyl) transferase LipB [Brumimicrobium aurantiacum]RFC55811.1 lipoyl(octanoyl) transferase LipB [Brumimicrobium aurantiacum]